MKRIAFKISLYSLAITLVIFFSAFVYYYVNDGIYEYCIPLIIIFGIEFVLEMLSISNNMFYRIRMILLGIAMLFIFYIIARIIALHPLIFLGFLVNLFLFLFLLYHNTSNNSDKKEIDE